MPTNKDFKRLTRSRMARTGESFTTARAHLLKKRKLTPVSATVDHTKLAGMSDPAVKKATGCDWALWVRVLDHAKAEALIT